MKCEEHVHDHMLEEPLTMEDLHFFSLTANVNGLYC